jgi:hypothetical protein
MEWAILPLIVSLALNISLAFSDNFVGRIVEAYVL